MARIVIFTDLDGTLLHPRTYSFEETKPALELIKEKNIPLIFCSSKTRAEIEVYRKKTGNKHPFISENGGGIFIPEGYFSESPSPQLSPQSGEGGVDLITPPPLTEGGKGEGGEYITITLGKPYSEIRNAFIEIRRRLGIKAKGFGDMLTEEIAELAGLPLSEAMLAKTRDFDEPFVFEEDVNNSHISPLEKGGKGGFEYDLRIKKFLKAIEEVGLHWTRGRFYHILGDNDKGKAVKILRRFFEKKYGKITTIGLGDNLNDLPMLKEMDYPIIVRKEDGSYEDKVSLPNLIKAGSIGPEGWNIEVLRLVNEIT